MQLCILRQKNWSPGFDCDKRMTLWWLACNARLFEVGAAPAVGVLTYDRLSDGLSHACLAFRSEHRWEFADENKPIELTQREILSATELKL